MAISSYSTTPASNTSISGINLAEGCNPSGINDAIRQMMADIATDATTNSGTQVLTNKTIDTAGPNTIKVNGNTLAATAGTATLTLPNSSDTIVGRATTDTLTNKTLTSPTITTPVITSINNGGTITIPSGTDTLLGRATTDTLTNKTFNTGGTGNVFQIAGTGITAVTGTGSVMLAASPTTTGTLTAASVVTGASSDVKIAVSGAVDIITSQTQGLTYEGSTGFVRHFKSAGGNWNIGHATSSGTWMTFWYTTSAIGSISATGTTNTAYNTSSDARRKENIRDFTTGLEVCKALQPRMFNWVAETVSPKPDDYGFIAQELLAIPEAARFVTTMPDGHYGVDYSRLTPLLVSAVKTLLARVEALEARV